MKQSPRLRVKIRVFLSVCWPLTPHRTWWWATRPASCAPCWRWTTPWRTASSGTGTTWSTCGTTPSAQRNSTSAHATVKSYWRSRQWTQPRTEKRSSRWVTQESNVTDVSLIVCTVIFMSLRFFFSVCFCSRWCLKRTSSQEFISPSRPSSHSTLKVGLCSQHYWLFVTTAACTDDVAEQNTHMLEHSMLHIFALVFQACWLESLWTPVTASLTSVPCTRASRCPTWPDASTSQGGTLHATSSRYQQNLTKNKRLNVSVRQMRPEVKQLTRFHQNYLKLQFIIWLSSETDSTV